MAISIGRLGEAVPYRLVEHTADIAIEVEADALDLLFADAARGLFDIVRGENEIRATDRRRVAVDASALDGLLLEFLEAFVFLQDAEGLVFHDVHNVRVSQSGVGWTAHADVEGEPFSHERHPGCVHVKAVTRHELDVQPPRDGQPARARVIFDI